MTFKPYKNEGLVKKFTDSQIHTSLWVGKISIIIYNIIYYILL